MNITPEQLVVLKADSVLADDQLDEKYNPNGGGSHPLFSRNDWREAVANNDTLLGYWSWLPGQIEDALVEAEEERENQEEGQYD